MSKFQKATKKKAKGRIALLGPSGSGKTFTALMTAKHLGKKIAVVDTERGSASKYAGDVADFDVLELTSYAPQRFIEALKDAAKEGYDVVVVDSLSHAWFAEGGILDQKDKSGGNGFDAWRKLTPQHNELVEAILAYPGHVIVTMRSKMEYVQEKDSKTGKTVIRKVGLAPVQRDGMEYEFDVIGEIDVDHCLHITKSRCRALADASIRKPEAQLAEQLLAWLDQGVDVTHPPPAPAPAPEKTETPPAASAPPKRAVPPAPAAVLDLVEAIVPDGVSKETLTWARAQISVVAEGRPRLAFALESVINKREAKIHDELWKADAEAINAAAWLIGQFEARQTERKKAAAAHASHEGDDARW